MSTEHQGPNFTQYWDTVKRRKAIIILTFATMVAATALVSWQMTPIYEGRARLEIQPVAASSAEASRVLESLVDPTRALQTQVELIKSKAVLDKAAQKLGLPSIEALDDSVKAELVQDTQIVEIAAKHERPEEARDWANAVAGSYIDFRRQRAVEQALSVTEDIARRIEALKPRIAELDQQAQAPGAAATLRGERERLAGQLAALEAQLASLPDAEALRRGGGSTITPAEAPSSPVRPNKRLNLALACIFGLASGLGLAFGAENLDDRIRSADELQDLVGAQVLGYIPLIDEPGDGKERFAATLDDPASGAAEAYRTLRTNLRFASVENPIRTLLVTSSLPEEGKSTTTVNLAVAFAQGGTKTVLVVADLRRPTAHKMLGASNSRGLLQALDPDSPLEKALQTTDAPGLRVLAPGGLPQNPTEVIASARFTALLTTLSHVADLVIIDSPPVLGFGEPSALASRVDGVLLVVEINQATRRLLVQAADNLRKAGGRIVGVVVNGVDPRSEAYYHPYYYDYHTEPQDDDEQPFFGRAR